MIIAQWDVGAMRHKSGNVILDEDQLGTSTLLESLSASYISINKGHVQKKHKKKKEK